MATLNAESILMKKKVNLNFGNYMKNQQIMKMKKMILGMFELKPGLREGDCLPPRWLLQSEIVNLNEQEKYALESAFNELHDDKLIEISKVENADNPQDQKIIITQAGVEYISKNKPVKKIIKKQNKNQIISDLLEDILPDD